MFRKIREKIIKITLVFFLSSLFLLSAKSFAQQQYSTTEDVVKTIEKSLLFDKNAQQKINFYKNKNRKNDIKIDNRISDSQDDDIEDSRVDIKVVDPKNLNISIREKEKMAYNASLVGQYEVAIELYKIVIAAEPDNYYAKFALGVVYQKIGQFAQAKTVYNQLLKDENVANREEIVGNLLAILIEESPRDTIYLLSRLMAQNPNSSYIVAQLAIAYEKIKNYDQAINLFKKAIAMDPDRLDYRYDLAVVYDKTSDYENALMLYTEVAKNYNSKYSGSISIDQVNKRIVSLRGK